MKLMLFALALLTSLAPAQWVEDILALPVAGTNLAVYNPAAGQVYVGGSGQHWVAALDGANAVHRAVIRTGGTVRAMAVDSTANRVYCAVPGQLDIIDCTSNRINHSVSMTSALVLCLNEPARKLYCACGTDVVVVEVDAGRVATTIPVGRRPATLCFNPQERKLYCAGELDSVITVIDAEVDSVLRQVPVDGRIRTMTYNPVNNRVYCADWWDNELLALDCTADTFAATVPVGLDPRALCVNTANNKVYCANYSVGTVSIVDAIADSVLATHAVGNEPTALAWDPGSNRIFCVAKLYAYMTVIDGEADTVAGQVHVASMGEAACVNPTDGKVFVPNGYYLVVSAVDAATLVRTDIISVAGYASVVCCTPGSGRVLVTGWDDQTMDEGGPINFITAYDGSLARFAGAVRGCGDPTSICLGNDGSRGYCGGTNACDLAVEVVDAIACSSLISIPTGEKTLGLHRRPATGDIYVAGIGTTSVIDGAGDSIKCRLPYSRPCDVAFNENLNRVYVSDRSSNRVIVYDGTSHEVLSAISVGQTPTTLCMNPTWNKLYVATSGMRIIDCATESTLASLELEAQAMCYNWRDDKVYATTYAHDGKVAVVDGAGDSLRRIVGAGRYPAAICYNSVNNKVYCAALSGSVFVIDGTSDQVVREVTLGAELRGMAWDSVTNRTYVTIHPPGQPGSLAILLDTIPVGVLQEPVLPMPVPDASGGIVRGSLLFPEAADGRPFRITLLDISGRRVLDLQPGENDIRHLSPGIYFIREEQARTTRKVIVTR